jgi:hypothetical protein
MKFQQALKAIHITKYMTKVIYEKHLIFTNRKKKQWKRFNWNHMYRTKTMWKYPPAFHNGKVDYDHVPNPDRKMFMIVLAIPIFGGVDNPAPDGMMPDVELEEVNHEASVQQRTVERGVSILDDAFQVKAEPMDDEDEAEGTPRRSAQLKGKGKDNVPSGGDSRPSSPDLEGMNNDDLNNYRVNLAARQKARQAAYNRRMERERMKKENPPPSKESLTNNYGWAYKQTILIRPTIDIHFKNMLLRCVGFR